MSVEEEIKEIVAGIVHVDKSILTREGSLRKDIKADSLDIVQALVAVEDKFDIEIPDEEAQKFQNFGDFVDYVERRVAEKEKV
ncbi:MAG: acyl carrier protein [Chloroflexi bacterium CG07_land_8_20_14_0_80_45_17]|nr:MAG: acyl carrier protein [Chloroflexi bacterium CG23_combo_of_CG06-09_8_20_14_all_45_10]PIU56377.1 MAG: acyl carrier protein [Chloroflexi bacterium CG07_land_8_20_14_0_80_45_17]